MGNNAASVQSLQAVCTCCTIRDDEYQSPAAARRPQSPYVSQYGLGLNTGPCVVCRDRAANTICLPCGHLIVCQVCARGLSRTSGLRCAFCGQGVGNFKEVLIQGPLQFQ
mmetsp:Transcript_161021/g.283773  ORF Transcript_161021/g.283773 Transcript_161021/m.283773 type:complete len:110 (-) Transcript_161021:40-369(-)